MQLKFVPNAHARTHTHTEGKVSICHQNGHSDPVPGQALRAMLAKPPGIRLHCIVPQGTHVTSTYASIMKTTIHFTDIEQHKYIFFEFVCVHTVILLF